MLNLLLLLAASALMPAAHAQIIGMEDMFSYTTANINTHAPSFTGTGAWGVYYDAGSNISTNGTCALITTGTTGRASASYAFVPQANTLYTWSAVVNFTGPGGGGWQGFGFSNSSDDGNHSNNPAPWVLIWAQATGTSNSTTTALTGNVSNGDMTVPASYFSAPMRVTVTWNTAINQATYCLNGILQKTWATNAYTPGQTFYAWFEGASTRGYTNVQNVTLSAETIAYSNIAMQDNFTYTSGSLNGCTPTTVMGSGWSTKWATSLSNGTISTNGAQARMSTNGGTPGAGNVVANFPFQVNANTFYTLRAAFNYSLMGSSYDCWGGLGFSNWSGTNMAPWMFIRPQAVSTDNPGTGFSINNTWIGSGSNCAASNYSAPITATITWNTANGAVCYYINDLLQATGTSSALPNGTFNAFFQGFKTGNVVNVNTVSLTAQPISQMPEVWFSPTLSSTSFSTVIDSGSCAWPTARSHTQVWNIYDNQLNDNNVMTAAQRITFINYLIAHNIKMAICIQPLVKTSNTCTWFEGYETPSVHTNAIAAIQTAIAGCSNPSWKPSYVSLDSPLCDCENTGTCNMSIATAASQTATTIGYFTSAWSGIQVVQYDGVDSFPSADVTAWFTAMANNGKPINAVIDDFSWYFGWTGRLQTAMNLCASSGVAFGNFWDGFAGVPGGNTNGNTPQFMLGQKINLQCLNASVCAAPTKVEVATWGNPTPCGTTVPETSGTTLSNMLDLALTSPYVLQAQPAALYAVYGNGYYNRYTSSYSTYLSWTGTGGYSDSGILGGIALNASACGIQGVVPIYLYCNTSMTPNQYGLSLSATDADLNSYGYTMQSTLGYVLPASTGAAMGGVPLYGAHKYVGPVNQYMYNNSPYTKLDDTFNPNNDYTMRLNGGNPIGYVLPNFFHNGYGTRGPN